MIVQFGNTAKRNNSTAIPTLTASYNCILKEGCSIVSPVIIIERANIGHSYNCAYIASFGRYYWIRDIILENARTFFYLETDVLATYKSDIGSSTQYVLRSASDQNEYIVDTFYPVSTMLRQSSDSLTCPWVDAGIGRGMYVMGIIGEEGVNYYGFTTSQFSTFLHYLMSKQFTYAVLDERYQASPSDPHGYELYPQLQMLVDPIQYITSCMWLPFNPTSTLQSTHVRAGCVNTGCDAYDVSYSTGARNVFASPYYITLTALNHPQEATRGAYLNSQGFTECRVNFPPFGSFELDALAMHDAVENSGSTRMQVVVDLFTGTGIMKIYTCDSNGVPLNFMVTATAQVGVPVPIVQVMSAGNSVMDIAQSAIGVVKSAINSDAGGVFGGINASLKSYYENKIPHASVVGSQGSTAELGQTKDFKIQWIWKIVADDDVAQHGRPLCETVQISTLSGFIMCLMPDVAIGGTREEAEQIEQYMSSGFFYE